MPEPSAILTINGGSSTVKFALFELIDAATLRPILRDKIDRIDASDQRRSALHVVDQIRSRLAGAVPAGIGHRVVHGGVKLLEHQRVTSDLIAELKRNIPLDLAHLPGEIALIEAFGGALGELPQVACFDTAFHRDLPGVTKLLPIPRRYDAAGVRRFGFHGLSYTYLMGELERVAGTDAANGRVVLAHLGNGASLAAVRGGKPIDTTMAFTPTAGLVMGTRPGDLDPGLLVYLMRAEDKTPQQMDEFISHECGLIGVSETTADMRDLVARRGSDVRAAEAFDLFCYSAKKWIGAYAAALGGLDTLVFAGGIGENSPEARAAIIAGLDFLGLRIDPATNATSQAIISSPGSRVTVRVMRTDEEIVIARAVSQLLSK
jgi:acetate kinase